MSIPTYEVTSDANCDHCYIDHQRVVMMTIDCRGISLCRACIIACLDAIESPDDPSAKEAS